MIDEVVAPVFHVPPILPDSITVPPAQNDVNPPAVIKDAVGSGVTITVLLQVLTHPPPFVTVTVYVPDVTTFIQPVVSPVFHKNDVHSAGAQRCVDSPSQIDASPVILQNGNG